MARRRRRRGFGTIEDRTKHADARSRFYAVFSWQGKRYRREAGPSFEVAERNLNVADAMLAAGVPVGEVLAKVFGDVSGSTLSFKDAAPKYLTYATGRKRPTSLADDTYRLGALSRASWATKHLAALSSSDFLPWIAERQKTRTVRRLRRRRPGETRGEFRAAPDRWEAKAFPGASNATVNKDPNLVSAVFRWAEKAGLVTDNPVRRVERLSEKGRAREVYLTAAECRAFVSAAPEALRPLVLMALHTGMRRGELLALAWRDVDAERKEVVVRPELEKAGRGRVIPMTTELHGLLDGLRRRRPLPALDGSDKVFVLDDGEPLTVATLRLLWDSAIVHVGTGIPPAKRDGLTFHALRHSAASLLVAAGVPILDVARILGHSTVAVTMRYAHFAPESGRKAITALGKALSVRPAKAPDRAKKRA